MFIRNTKIMVYAFLLIMVFAFLFSGSAQAKNVKEHPLIRPFPSSVLAKNMSKYLKFNAFDFYYKNEKTKKREKRKVKGEYYSLLYEVRTKSGKRVQDISAVEFFENYKTAAVQKGGKVVYEDRGQVVFTIPKDDGGLTWCRVNVSANLGQQYLTIIDEKGMKQSMVFGPKELKAALDKDGKVLLYGILFDLNKANLKPESVKQLQHVVTLMLTYPDLSLEVQGHTDSQASDAYNMELSQKRAQTVCTYLQLFGIQSKRLVAKGYGETKPVASNDTKEGQAKNRRVELVKMSGASTRATPPAMAKTEQKSQGKGAPVKSAEKIEGKWRIDPNKRMKRGIITFRANRTYQMEEWLQDGDHVGRKGQFKISRETSPFRMDLCLLRCGAPGSEYTTYFSIFRFLPDGRVEIHFSPEGKYPKKFNNGAKDGYTMILTRVE